MQIEREKLMFGLGLMFYQKAYVFVFDIELYKNVNDLAWISSGNIILYI